MSLAIFFDSDGTVLNTNQLKKTIITSWIESLKLTASESEKVSDYFVNAYGSREHKLRGIEIMLGVQVDRARFADFFSDSLFDQVDEIEQNHLLISQLKGAGSVNCGILTAGDQRETKELYKKLGILELFPMGIYGSPTEKVDFLRKNKAGISLYVGDQASDHEAAIRAGVPYLKVAWEGSIRALEFTQNIHTHLVKACR